MSQTTEQHTGNSATKTRRPRLMAMLGEAEDGIPIPKKPSRGQSPYENFVRDIQTIPAGKSAKVKNATNLFGVKSKIKTLPNAGEFYADEHHTEKDGHHIRVWRLAPAEAQGA